MTAVDTTPATGTTPTPPVDRAALVGRCMDDPAFAAMVLTKFRAKVPGMFDQIAAAAAAGDAAALGQAAHALKGSAANLAADEVRDLACRLEAAGHAGSVAAAEPVVADLRVAISRLVGFIPELVAQLQ